MEESTVPGGDSSIPRMPALMQYDDAVLKFADARLQYKNSILKYRNLLKEQELSTLKRLTYADVHQLAPDVEKNIVPQLVDQNEKRKQLIREVKLEKDFERRNQNVRNEISMISKILLSLEKEEKRLN